MSTSPVTEALFQIFETAYWAEWKVHHGTEPGQARRAGVAALLAHLAAGHAQSSQEPGDPEIKELRRLADDLVAEGWHDDAVFVRSAANTIERHAQKPTVPWKGNLSVDLRRGSLRVNADGVALIDEAGTAWALVFPDKNGFYEHAATIAAALSDTSTLRTTGSGVEMIDNLAPEDLANWEDDSNCNAGKLAVSSPDRGGAYLADGTKIKPRALHPFYDQPEEAAPSGSSPLRQTGEA